jgi:autotransporter-associated beta strand protein
LGGVGEWTTGTSGEGTLGGLLAGLGGQVGSTVSYTGNVGLDLVTTGNQSYGAIANVGTSLALTKSGTGTLSLTGTNTYTGATTLSGGTLILDITTDDTKLANGAGLNLNGGTLTLKGGALPEIVSGTNLNAGHTAITRNGGTAKLRMNNLNRAAGDNLRYGSGQHQRHPRRLCDHWQRLGDERCKRHGHCSHGPCPCRLRWSTANHRRSRHGQLHPCR